ncbi:MAG: DHH family phosphoesterase, partial [Candidatus Riflebacteria bacterium]|nr:DHH family phosphoesterase [Candidatus Riflebacteria bacterium]
MEKVWKLRDVSEAALGRLRSTGFPDILLKILVNRGITDPVSIEKYFSPRSRYLFSPFVIDGLCPAVDRIFKAIERDESIRVYGDRDVDGITSTVLLTETLRSFHKLVDYTVPVIEDGYGLNPDYIDVAVRDGIKLIITVDCGISNIAEVGYARSKGIEVIITDHHEPPSQLPDAVAIVDPKLHDSCCPQKNIAGVGVAFKMAMALEMARCNRLSRPLLVFDYSDHNISAVRFSVREGFNYVKNIDRTALTGCVPVFYSLEERKAIGEVLPVVLTPVSNDPAFKPVYVDKVIAECLPDAAEQTKETFRKSLNLDEMECGRALTLIYLKCI